VNLPPVVYSLAFWKAVSYILAVVAVAGDVADPLTVAKILGAILAVLNLLGVNPELKAKGLK